jgi:hypothetical protein
MWQFSKITLAKVAMAAAVLSCVATLAQQTNFNYMPGTNFAKYHTYKWVTIKGGFQPDQIVDEEVKQAVDGQLAAKGLTRTDGDKPDLEIGYSTGLDRHKEWNAWGSGGGPYWGGMGMAQATSSTITDGTLVVDMYDPATKQLVWTGAASGTINLSSKQQKNLKNLDKAVQKLLKNYPPQYK